MEESIPTVLKDNQMNIKVTIQLHNVLGIDPANLSSKQYTAFPHLHRPSWGHNINCRFSSYWPSRTCMCAYKALPYTLKGCNIEIDINNETRSFCFIPSTDDIYANIPIVFARHHRFRCPYSSEYDNRRLFQIAQKCFENVTRENRFVDPLWKYKKRHYIKDTFVPSVCVLRDLLLDVVPLHVDIINVLIEYLGCAQFECVVIESTVNIPAQYQDILLEDARKKNIQLRCGTKYGVKYLSPFDKDTITLISAKMEYSYEYNWKWQEIKAIEYTKPRTKRCLKLKAPKAVTGRPKPLHKWVCDVLNDDVYDEAQRRHDMKRRKTKGKKRKRRNRKYLVKPMMTHRRRKKKKKYRKHVHHPVSIKKKRFKSKVKKALQRRHGRWEAIPQYEYSTINGNRTWECKWLYHQPNYCYHFNYIGRSALYASGSNYIKRWRSNKRCAPKRGRKNTRGF
eukprot:701896_1